MQRPGDGGVPGGAVDSVTVMPEMTPGLPAGEANEDEGVREALRRGCATPVCVCGAVWFNRVEEFDVEEEFVTTSSSSSSVSESDSKFIRGTLVSELASDWLLFCPSLPVVSPSSPSFPGVFPLSSDAGCSSSSVVPSSVAISAMDADCLIFCSVSSFSLARMKFLLQPFWISASRAR